MSNYKKYKEYQQKYQKERFKEDPEYYRIAARDSQARLTELVNAPRFRKYIIELLDFAEAKEQEPDLTYKRFKKRIYNETSKNKQT